MLKFSKDINLARRSGDSMKSFKLAAAASLAFLLSLSAHAKQTDYLLGEIKRPGGEAVPCIVKITSGEEAGSKQFIELTYKSVESLRTDVFLGEKSYDNSFLARDAFQELTFSGFFADDTLEAGITDRDNNVVFLVSVGDREAIRRQDRLAEEAAAPAADLKVTASQEKKTFDPQSGGKNIFEGKLYENDASSFPLRAEMTVAEGGRCEIALNYKGTEEKFAGTLEKTSLTAFDGSGNTLNCSIDGPALNGVKLLGGTYQAYYFRAEDCKAPAEAKAAPGDAEEKTAGKKLSPPIEKYYRGKFKEKDKESTRFSLSISKAEKGVREFLFTVYSDDGTRREELLLGAMGEGYFKAAVPLGGGEVMTARGRFKDGRVTGSVFLGDKLLGSFSALDLLSAAQKAETSDLATTFWKGEITKDGETWSLRLICGRDMLTGLDVIQAVYTRNSMMYLASFSGKIKDGSFSAKDDGVYRSELESIEGTYTSDSMEGEITFRSGVKASFRAVKREGPQ